MFSLYLNNDFKLELINEEAILLIICTCLKCKLYIDNLWSNLYLTSMFVSYYHNF